MLRFLCCVLPLFLLIPPAAVQAQSDAGVESVLAPIRQLFDGMRAGDSTAVRAVFAEGARMQTVAEDAGEPALRNGSVDDFVEAVGRPHDAVWDERIWEPLVRIDGALAVAWMPYAFYLGDTLSHCGVNAFHLIRRADGWKIVSLVDTRRHDNCVVPPEAQK